LVGEGFPIVLPESPEQLVKLMQDERHSFAVEMGLQVAQQLLQDEVQQLCGNRYERPEDRTMSRYGQQGGVITLAGQKLPIQRPRVRLVHGQGEVPLETYRVMQQPQAMPQAVLRRMVRGVSCRDYEGVVELAREGFGVQKSSVSRGFVKASSQQVEAFLTQRFDHQRFVVIFIDSLEFAGETMVCALGITAHGDKRVLGVRQGASENAEVVAALLEDLVSRGIPTRQATLFVIDGAKALRAGIGRVWGRWALVQRCQVHKKRNVVAHTPQTSQAELLRRLNEAYHETSYDEALEKLQSTARWLARICPDAAASLREGMEETLTILRLPVGRALRRTLATTNPIESAFDRTRSVTRRVKRWREGDMRQRWCIAGLLRAQNGFRRVKGYRQIPQLIAALEALVLDGARKVC
jgi:transposase-like protein